MNHDHLRILLEIARHGNFSGVAKQRNIDPSSISRIVRTVENELGVRIFHRTTRHVTLTEAGSIYLTKVSELLDAIDRAGDTVKELGGKVDGVLRVTASVAFGQTCLVPLLPDFLKVYPNIQLELFLADANLDIVAERIDLALRLSPRMDKSFVRVKWFHSSYRLCASPRYVARHGAVLSPGDLSRHRCVLFGLPNPQDEWLMRDRAGSVQRVNVKPYVCVSNGLAQRELVLGGAGLALMPAWLAAEDLFSGRLVDVLPNHIATPGEYDGAAWLLYPNRTLLPSKTRALVDYLLSRTKPEWSDARTAFE
jgi:DNA-binding transcriptional LysR family regulator